MLQQKWSRGQLETTGSSGGGSVQSRVVSRVVAHLVGAKRRPALASAVGSSRLLVLQQFYIQMTLPGPRGAGDAA